MTTRSRRTRSGEPKALTISFTHGGTTYHLPIEGEVGIHTIDDWPTPVPQSGAQNPNDRQLRNKLTIKNIRNAFAGKTGLDWERQGGVINELHDSEAWTHQGPITHARLQQDVVDDTDTSMNTELQRLYFHATANPRPAVIYRADGDRALYLARSRRYVDSGSGTNYWRSEIMRLDLDTFVFRNEATRSFGSASLTNQIKGFVLHKGSIYEWHWENRVSRKTSSGWVTLSNSPSLPNYPGSKLLSDGGILYAFGVSSDSDGPVWRVSSTEDEGATPWASHVTEQSGGRVWDVGLFADRSGTERVVVLTEQQLVWFDPDNDVVRPLLTLPTAGRAFARLGDKLLIFMGGMRVWEYSASGAIRDISPGAMEGMPPNKAFGADADGMVCLTESLAGIYALWSGTAETGSDLAPLILLYTGEGWHFIWQHAASAVSDAARFLVFVPDTGDLVWGIQVADADEITTLFRMKRVETPYDLLGSDVEFQESSHVTTTVQDFGNATVPTTLLDAGVVGYDLSDTETAQVRYGANGAEPTAQDLGTTPTNSGTDLGSDLDDMQSNVGVVSGAVFLTGHIICVGSEWMEVTAVSRNTLTVARGVGGTTAAAHTTGDDVYKVFEPMTFPDTSSAEGRSVRTVQVRMDLARAAGADNDHLSPKVAEAEVYYFRRPDVRYGYSVRVRTDLDILGGRNGEQIQADLRKILNVKTKGTLEFGGWRATVLPLTRTQAREALGDSAEAQVQRAGVWDMVFVEV